MVDFWMRLLGDLVIGVILILVFGIALAFGMACVFGPLILATFSCWWLLLYIITIPLMFAVPNALDELCE